MLSAPFARPEERKVGAPERGGEMRTLEVTKTATTSTGMATEATKEAKQQPAQQQQLSVPLAAPDLQQAPSETAITLPEEVAAAPEEQAQATRAEEEGNTDAKDGQDQSLSPPLPPPQAASGSNHRVRPQLAGDAAAISLVITSGASAEAKVAQRVVNRSGQKALQGFFSEVFETVTAS